MPAKIFVGNIAVGTTSMQLKELFEQHGNVVECDILGGYGFIHMATEEDAVATIKALNGYNINGSRLNIELSTSSTQGRARIAARSTSTTKIFVGNISKSTTNEKLKELFETYGGVTEADVLSGFAFVHMSNEQEAFKAIKALNGYIVDGNRMNVELSTGGTQGKAKDRDSFSRGPMSARGRSAGIGRFEPYAAGPSLRRPPPPPPPPPPLDPYNSHGGPGGVGPGAGGGGGGYGDSFARDLLELYIRNRSAFDSYARDPLVRKAMNLPPVEADDGNYFRSPGPVPPPPPLPRDHVERRIQSRFAEMGVQPLSLSAGESFSSPSADFASPSSSSLFMGVGGGGAAGRPWLPPPSSSYGGPDDAFHSASASGRGHHYSSFN